MTRWYRIHWIDDKSYSVDCYTYGDAWAAAKAETTELGRFKIVPAKF